jgi:hypothetical protein
VVNTNTTKISGDNPPTMANAIGITGCTVETPEESETHPNKKMSKPQKRYQKSLTRIE